LKTITFTGNCNCRRLFMPYVNPLDSFACANRIRDSVERVAENAVDSRNSHFRQYIHQQVCYVFPGQDDIFSQGVKNSLLSVNAVSFCSFPPL
jgi:hypothetical protein